MSLQQRINGSLTIEGDTLVYKVTGKGRPLLLIPGGGGNGDYYLPLADELSKGFQVITYDRRGNSRSTMNFPNHFDIAQEARDALAILKASGNDSAFVFGNSSGAVIALEMAQLYPESVIGAIAHEPPMAKFHPDRQKWQKFFNDCYETSLKRGASLAAAKFMFGIEVPVMQLIQAQKRADKYLKEEPKIVGKKKIPSKLASKYLMEQELLKVTDYEPDIDFIKAHMDKYIFAVGAYAKKRGTFLFQIVSNISDIIEKPYVVMSGHHGSFMDDSKVWAEAIRELLKTYKNGDEKF